MFLFIVFWFISVKHCYSNNNHIFYFDIFIEFFKLNSKFIILLLFCYLFIKYFTISY